MENNEYQDKIEEINARYKDESRTTIEKHIAEFLLKEYCKLEEDDNKSTAYLLRLTELGVSPVDAMEERRKYLNSQMEKENLLAAIEAKAAETAFDERQKLLRLQRRVSKAEFVTFLIIVNSVLLKWFGAWAVTERATYVAILMLAVVYADIDLIRHGVFFYRKRGWLAIKPLGFAVAWGLYSYLAGAGDYKVNFLDGKVTGYGLSTICLILYAALAAVELVAWIIHRRNSKREEEPDDGE
ncbi:MAG: hypothetical protein LBN00_08500 [Oscillospiraceae bacterium]|jgi:hypothetical protein|nr:hypothetical protein [Oscillospiraceae bacterium]